MIHISIGYGDNRLMQFTNYVSVSSQEMRQIRTVEIEYSAVTT